MDYRVHTFEKLASTNDSAADKQYLHGDIIVAKFQSSGRGQRGNKWISKDSENLMFSLVVEPREILVREQFLISMATAVAVAHTISSFGVEGVEVKWPNDIMVRDEKISGILIEHSFCSEFLSRTIIGVGINVRQTQFGSNAGVPTSLHLQGATDATPEIVLERFCLEFNQYYGLPADELLAQYTKIMYRREGIHNFEDKDGKFQASIHSINPLTGLLTLQDTNHNLRNYYFKEVSFLLNCEL